MKKYIELNPSKSVNLTDYPPIDHKDFQSLLNSNFFGEYSKHAKNMNEKGFCLLEIKDKNWFVLLDKIVGKLKTKIKGNILSPMRWQDAWYHHNIYEISQLANHPEILKALVHIYGRTFFPFQTLNFPNGSDQHVHSDAVHFHTLPKGFMCGIWIAMENVHEDAGPLFYYPKSHRLPYVMSKTLDISFEEISNSKYPQKFFEPYWRNILKENDFEKEIFLAKKGQVLIWHSNILHGGSKIKNKNLTRWSQVTHYFAEDCFYTTPIYMTKDEPIDSPSIRRVRRLLA